MRMATLTAIDSEGKEFVVVSEAPFSVAKEKCLAYIASPAKGVSGVWLRPTDQKPKWFEVAKPAVDEKPEPKAKK